MLPMSADEGPATAGRSTASCARSSRRSRHSTARPARPASARRRNGSPAPAVGSTATRVALEDEPSWGTFPPTATGSGRARRSPPPALVAGRAARGSARCSPLRRLAGIVDEAQNGPRILRRLLRRAARRSTWWPRRASADGERQDTLVVIAHHDAPQTGLLFDQSLQRRLYELAPQRSSTRKHLSRNGGSGWQVRCARSSARSLRGAASAAPAWRSARSATALVADVWRSADRRRAPTTTSRASPALVALAELLRRRPPPGVRVLLVSCGAEETLQDGDPRLHGPPPRRAPAGADLRSSTSTRSARRIW